MIRSGQGGEKVYNGGKNSNRFGSEWALMCGRMKRKDTIVVCTENTGRLWDLLSKPTITKHTQATHRNHAGYAFNYVPLSDRRRVLSALNALRGAPHTTGYREIFRVSAKNPSLSGRPMKRKARSLLTRRWVIGTVVRILRHGADPLRSARRRRLLRGDGRAGSGDLLVRRSAGTGRWWGWRLRDT